MKIQVKCYANLSEMGHCDYENSRTKVMETGANVRELINRLGLPKDRVEIIFVNGKRVDSGKILSDGDHVGLFPAVGGM